MMVEVAVIGRLAVGLVWQSLWCFALCCQKNTCTCRGQHLTQSHEAIMTNVTSALSGLIVSSLLIFLDIFVEFTFSVENEVSIKSF